MPLSPTLGENVYPPSLASSTGSPPDVNGRADASEDAASIPSTGTHGCQIQHPPALIQIAAPQSALAATRGVSGRGNASEDAASAPHAGASRRQIQPPPDPIQPPPALNQAPSPPLAPVPSAAPLPFPTVVPAGMSYREKRAMARCLRDMANVFDQAADEDVARLDV